MTQRSPYLCGRLRLYRPRDHRRHDGHEHTSSLDLGHTGFGSGHDRHVCRNRAHDGCLCGENNRRGFDGEGMVYVLDGEIVLDGHLNQGHVQNQNQSARMLKVAYGPTADQVS